MRHGLRQGYVLAPVLLNMLYTAVVRVAVERFSANADVVCTKDENVGGTRGAGKRAR